MSTRIIVTGALGRMGTEIAKATLADTDTELVGGLEVPGHPREGDDMGVVAGGGEIGVHVATSLDSLPLEGAVVIDFTVPQATESLITSLNGTGAKLVIGTTGLSDGQIEQVKRFGEKHAVVFSPNMSLGINLLFYLTELVARKLGSDFDIEIVEAHHRFKKDAPSGTAKRLGEIAAEAIDSTYDAAIINGRSGLGPERTAGEIGMHAIRGGDIVGDHTVLFAGLGERVELRHMAHNRSVFVNGAVRAAKWLDARETGMYSMKDVLGL